MLGRGDIIEKWGFVSQELGATAERTCFEKKEVPMHSRSDISTGEGRDRGWSLSSNRTHRDPLGQRRSYSRQEKKREIKKQLLEGSTSGRQRPPSGAVQGGIVSWDEWATGEGEGTENHQGEQISVRDSPAKGGVLFAEKGRE